MPYGARAPGALDAALGFNVHPLAVYTPLTARLRCCCASLLSELREMDANKDGHISAREFCRAVAKLDGLGTRPAPAPRRARGCSTQSCAPQGIYDERTEALRRTRGLVRALTERSGAQ
jgi:hypothetical protein